MAQHISTTLADLAWEQYEIASAAAARYLKGDQLDFITITDERAACAFWLDTFMACERESLVHVATAATPMRNAHRTGSAKEGKRHA
ncbi:hypothetical protein [Lysobacter antibioticus]|uniref:hypothetical protein n=1 Tax=Lysobacter antibioticus TaxID=84531 RepID=UPI00034B4D1B|nr:hypothetical protein [Lysobacter antibioticus]